MQYEIQNGDIKDSVNFLSETFRESTAGIGEPKGGNPMQQQTSAPTGAAAPAPPPPAPIAEQGVILDECTNLAIPTESMLNPTNNTLTLNMQSCEDLKNSQDQKTFDRKKHKENQHQVNIMAGLK